MIIITLTRTVKGYLNVSINCQSVLLSEPQNITTSTPCLMRSGSLRALNLQ